MTEGVGRRLERKEKGMIERKMKGAGHVKSKRREREGGRIGEANLGHSEVT